MLKMKYFSKLIKHQLIYSTCGSCFLHFPLVLKWLLYFIVKTDSSSLELLAVLRNYSLFRLISSSISSSYMGLF